MMSATLSPALRFSLAHSLQHTDLVPFPCCWRGSRWLIPQDTYVLLALEQDRHSRRRCLVTLSLSMFAPTCAHVHVCTQARTKDQQAAVEKLDAGQDSDKAQLMHVQPSFAKFTYDRGATLSPSVTRGRRPSPVASNSNLCFSQSCFPSQDEQATARDRSRSRRRRRDRSTSPSLAKTVAVESDANSERSRSPAIFFGTAGAKFPRKNAKDSE